MTSGLVHGNGIDIHYRISGDGPEPVVLINAVADGVIVGTSLKVDGVTWNPVDPARARRFVDTARQARRARLTLTRPC